MTSGASRSTSPTEADDAGRHGITPLREESTLSLLTAQLFSSMAAGQSLIRPTGLILLALGSLGGCDATRDSFCTEQFVTVTAVVVDGTGTPMVDAVVTSTLVRTGEILPPTGLVLFTPGTYAIVDDGARSKLLPAGDSIRVDARRAGGPSTTADYLIDVPGGCHVHKLLGPDTLAVQ